MRVLLITYYWPPSGGAGVQRWLKLSYYLAELGVEIDVVTVDPDKSSYGILDDSLLNEIHPKVTVHKTGSFEAINIFSKLFGSKHVPKAGFVVSDKKGLFSKLALILRSNLFIPDPRVGWNKYAYKKATELIKAHNYQAVITTSPPHSTQLVGLKLKKTFTTIKWVCDLRDPWTDLYYYNELLHSKLSHTINKAYERSVLGRADFLSVVGPGMEKLVLEKNPKANVKVITNGYDALNFAGKTKTIDNVFNIVYTGTMSSIYAPFIFIDQVQRLTESFKDTEVELKIVGTISNDIHEYLKAQPGLNYKIIPPLSHKAIAQVQLDADLLWLAIPDYQDSDLILTGKIFEYIATKNRIINIGPPNGDAALMLRKARLGETLAHADKEGIYHQLVEEIASFRNGGKTAVDEQFIESLSRENQAKQFKCILNAL